MSQDNLALVANPGTIDQINAAGGNLPSLAAAVAAASAKEKEAIILSATESATTILQSATAAVTTLVDSKIALEKSLAENTKQTNKLATARAYFEQTNNIFPLQKLLGIPTKAAVLARYPDIEKIPEGWGTVVETTAT